MTMLQALVNHLTAAMALPVQQPMGLAVQGEEGPMLHAGGGDFVPVEYNGSLSYWRLLSARSEDAPVYGAGGVRHVWVLRLVIIAPMDCTADEALLSATAALRRALPSARAALGALMVDTLGTATVADAARAERLSVPLNLSLGALDITLGITVDASCSDACIGVDPLCAMIGEATNSEIKACLGERLQDICDGGGPQVPTTVNGVTSDVPDITVVRGGVQVGSLDAATGVHTVPGCPPSLPGTVNLKNSEGTTLDTVEVPCGATVEAVAPDGVVQLKDDAGNNLGPSVAVVSGGDKIITAPNATAQLKDSAGAKIGAPYPILSGDTRDIPVADSTITLPNGMTKQVKATQPYTVPLTAPLKFVLAAYHEQSMEWTVTSDEAGQYNAFSADGSSGTITYSKNGAAFAAPSGTITLAASDKIRVKRTAFSAAGWVKWGRLVTP